MRSKREESDAELAGERLMNGAGFGGVDVDEQVGVRNPERPRHGGLHDRGVKP